MPTHPQLQCRACGVPAPGGGPQYCEACFGPIDLPPDWIPADAEHRPWTPLLPLPEIADELGIGELWAKVEGANRTGSFKDRLVASALVRAGELGQSTVACSSTGNLARALTVATAEDRSLGAVILVPDSLASRSVDAMVDHGASVVRVEGGYDAVNRLSAEAAMELTDWGWVNVGLRAWYVAGGRTVAREIDAQLDGSIDAVVVPAASGGLAWSMHTSFRSRSGVTDPPALCVVQPAGCSPMATAFDSGAPIRPVRPATDVEALAMGDPPDGDDVVDACRATGGAVVAVVEASLDGWRRRLRSHGVYAGRAGAMAVAGVADLVASGAVGPSDRVVAVVSDGSPKWPTGSSSVTSGRSVTLAAEVERLVEAVRDQEQP